MQSYCNNISRCHHVVEISDGDSAMRWICKECKETGVIRKDPFKQVPEIRQYVKVFRRDALQGKDPLFYKYYSQYLIK